MHHYHHYHLRRHYHRRRHGRRRRRVFYVAFQKAEDPKIVPHAFQAVKAQALNIKLEITEKVKILYIFYRATLCVSAVFAVAQCPSVCPSVCHVRAFYRNAKDISSNFFVGPVAPPF